MIYRSRYHDAVTIFSVIAILAALIALGTNMSRLVKFDLGVDPEPVEVQKVPPCVCDTACDDAALEEFCGFALDEIERQCRDDLRAFGICLTKLEDCEKGSEGTR